MTAAQPPAGKPPSRRHPIQPENFQMKTRYCIAAALFALLLGGCVSPNIHFYPDRTRPFQEVVLEGDAREKVLLLPLSGTITDAPGRGFLGDRPSPVQEIVSRLRRAEKDEDVRAVVLQINSPGGTVTGSDILYHELAAYKERTGDAVVAVMMDVAASGGYYVALAADRIVAHPTTVTGSIGVVFLRPNVRGLAERIGVDVAVSKTGSNKDMGSPFRAPTAEEEALFQDLTDRMGRRFHDLVARRRALSADALTVVRTARVFHADEALGLGLVDRIGYLSDAFGEARSLAGLPDGARVVAYRRAELAEDTVYNTTDAQTAGTRPALVETGPLGTLTALDPGFHYLWLPGASAR